MLLFRTLAECRIMTNVTDNDLLCKLKNMSGHVGTYDL